MSDAVPSTDAHASVAWRLAAFAHGLRTHDIPPPVRARALDLLLDAMGVALAANRYPFAERILAGVTQMASAGAGAEGGCSVIGRALTLPPRDAALVNGALIHGLDFDDTHVQSVVHASAATLPAVLAVGEHVGASGEELLSAYVCGVEVAVRLGLAKPFGLHEHGYHATGVVAHFAAALAAGRLLGLSVAQLAHAQGITGSTAMASQEFAEEGAWTKRLHPGWGAIAGITAAFLARAGFQAPSRPYEGRYGIYRLHLGADDGALVDYDAITRSLGERWEVMACAVKPFPACHFNHAVADSALALHARGVHADEVEHMRVLVPEQTLPVIAEPVHLKRRPRSDYEAKFSAPFVAAAALVRGRFGLQELEDEALDDPDILALAARTECVADPRSAFPRFFSGGVEVRTRDGRTHQHHEPVNRGAGERALSADEIEAKFLQCATLWVDREQACTVRDAVRRLPETHVAGLMAALRR